MNVSCFFFNSASVAGGAFYGSLNDLCLCLNEMLRRRNPPGVRIHLGGKLCAAGLFAGIS